MNRPPPRLYLVTPELDDTASFARDLDSVLTSADIAAVLLRLADADERALVNRAKTVAAAVQRRDIALLLDGRVEIVGRVGADGAHLTGIEAFTAALPSLKPDRIAGAGGLRSRHDAMLAGESGADYVLFGEPDRRGNRPQWGRWKTGSNGGPISSKCRASAMPERQAKSGCWRRPAPISSRWVIGYGRIRKAQPRR
jgi:thiamine-phosphate pyrophosphorylase